MSLKVRKIESVHNKNIKKLIKEIQKFFVFEGEKVVRDIINRGIKTRIIIANVKTELSSDLKNIETGELWLANRTVLKKISSMKNTPNLIAIAEFDPDPIDFSTDQIIIGLDNIQDPGNMGTLFRCAAAFGIRSIALSGECVNINNSKFLRAAQNSIFSIRTNSFKNLNSLLKRATDNGYNIYLASPKTSGTKEKIENIKNPSIVVIGSEGKGINEELLMEFKNIKIDQSEEVESLNAGISGCIIMNSLKKMFDL